VIHTCFTETKKFTVSEALLHKGPVRGWVEEGEQEAYNRTLVWKHVVVHTCFNKTTKFTA